MRSVMGMEALQPVAQGLRFKRPEPWMARDMRNTVHGECIAPGCSTGLHLLIDQACRVGPG